VRGNKELQNHTKRGEAGGAVTVLVRQTNS
jgi:hypothetical protein